MMTSAQAQLNVNPILTSLLLGMGQGNMIAERLMPRLPQALSGITLGQTGNAHMKRYSLERAGTAATKRVDIKLDSKVYTVKEYSVEVPISRKLMRDADVSRALNVVQYLDLATIATTTANQILALDYELQVADLARNVNTYPAGHVLALAGATKWSASTGTPVTDIRTAAEIIRKKTGKRPNLLTLGPDAWQALCTNAEVNTYLPATQTGPATIEQLKQILNVEDIVIGDAIWLDSADVGQDVWGNNAMLSYAPKIGGSKNDISLAEPAFGFTNVIEGHPFAENPYYEDSSKAWVFGSTFERLPNVAYPQAGFLFTNPK